jgi:riboflavin synthase alpha subunit
MTRKLNAAGNVLDFRQSQYHLILSRWNRQVVLKVAPSIRVIYLIVDRTGNVQVDGVHLTVGKVLVFLPQAAVLVIP